MNSLKPCPACGSTNLITISNVSEIAIQCNSCGLEGPLVNLLDNPNAREEAIVAWNNRYDSDDLTRCYFCGAPVQILTRGNKIENNAPLSYYWHSRVVCSKCRAGTSPWYSHNLLESVDGAWYMWELLNEESSS